MTVAIIAAIIKPIDASGSSSLTIAPKASSRLASRSALAAIYQLHNECRCE
jgi:hypothetical protein